MANFIYQCLTLLAILQAKVLAEPCKTLIIGGFLSQGVDYELTAAMINEKCPECKAEVLTSPLGLIQTPTALLHCLMNIVDKYAEKIRKGKYMEDNPNGVCCIGHSQGGLICRALVERMTGHNFKKLITIASPHMGLSGIPAVNSPYVLPSIGTSGPTGIGDPQKICYPIQCVLSICDFWRDPRYLEEYQKKCIFLPQINNEITHENSTVYKENFLKLDKFIMLYTPNDEIVIPWQSEIFGSRGPTNEPDDIIPMEKQLVFLNDTFGLKTLSDRGGVVSKEFTCDHITFILAPDVITYLAQHLSDTT